MQTIKYYVQKGVPVTQVVIKKGMKGFPLLAVLQLIFVVAKIFDKLDWSWFMVFWPMWIAPAIFLGIIGIIIAIVILVIGGAFLLDFITYLKRKWKKK